MRILVTADLHYDITRSREPTERLARDALRIGGDCLVLVGDTAGVRLAALRDCLRLFAEFPGRKLLVPGNHCLWCYEGECSLERYQEVLPTVAGEEGFGLLDHEPVVIGGVGLVGSVGWYDYSFRDRSLDIPLPFYQAKVSPGAAERLEEHDELVAAHRDQLQERHWQLGVRWMDGQHVRLPMSDEAFTDMLADQLRRQLAEVSERCEQIVAFIHHLPFGELVPPDRPDRFAFAGAYMGAGRLGEALLACEKLTHVYCGHSHWSARRRIGQVSVVNVGSTYVDKRLETLDLTPTECESVAPHAPG
ncbi:MAG: metallophosphoesterase family protein [Planctomycetota bacterium]|jgi:predicted phosphohydrolase